MVQSTCRIEYQYPRQKACTRIPWEFCTLIHVTTAKVQVLVAFLQEANGDEDEEGASSASRQEVDSTAAAPSHERVNRDDRGGKTKGGFWFRLSPHRFGEWF